MKFTVALIALPLLCTSLLAPAELLARPCQSTLISGNDGRVLDTFHEQDCQDADRRCNHNLRRLMHQYPAHYQNSYCDTAWDSDRYRDHDRDWERGRDRDRERGRHRDWDHDRGGRCGAGKDCGRVVRAYDRCQADGVVRCTQEWSNGESVIEDHRCEGCRGFGNPAGDPCGWRCSFPQK